MNESRAWQALSSPETRQNTRLLQLHACLDNVNTLTPRDPPTQPWHQDEPCVCVCVCVCVSKQKKGWQCGPFGLVMGDGLHHGHSTWLLSPVTPEKERDPTPPVNKDRRRHSCLPTGGLDHLEPPEAPARLSAPPACSRSLRVDLALPCRHESIHDAERS